MTKDQIKAVVHQLFANLEQRVATHPLEVAALEWLNQLANAEIDALVAQLAGGSK